MDDSVLIVFYSWQSDRPNNTNRGLIGDALESAAATISSDEALQVEPVIDRDTAGVPGAPSIAETILEKISRSAIFVADVTLIGVAEGRPVPNPNVMIELGYAFHCLGRDRVVLIQNTEFGPPSDLPFDLRMTRVITYRATHGGAKAGPRKQLAATLVVALRASIDAIQIGEREETGDGGRVGTIRNLVQDQTKPIDLDREVTEVVSDVVDTVNDSEHADPDSRLDEATYAERVRFYDSISSELIQVFGMGGAWAASGQLGPYTRGLLRLVSLGIGSESGRVETPALGRYLAMTAASSFGLGCIANDNWPALTAVLLNARPRIKGERRWLADLLSPMLVLDRRLSLWLPEQGDAHTPWSRHLSARIYPELADIIVDQTSFDEVFDQWELLLALQYQDRVSAPKARTFAPWGDYLWRTSTSAFSDFRQQIALLGDDWPPCRLDLLTSRGEEINALIDQVEGFTRRIRTERGIFS